MIRNLGGVDATVLLVPAIVSLTLGTPFEMAIPGVIMNVLGALSTGPSVYHIVSPVYHARCCLGLRHFL